MNADQTSNKIYTTVAVEGMVDEAVVRRLVRIAGGSVDYVYGKNGKKDLLKKLPAYNKAATFSRWTVLVDLDQDAGCAVEFKSKYLPVPAPFMCFRIAVHEVEAWLMADRERIAQFLGISLALVPKGAEYVLDPKQALINLARHSTRRNIKEDIIPRPGSGRQVGQAYSFRLTEFINNEALGWRPDVAALSSDSLRRCLKSLSRLLVN